MKMKKLVLLFIPTNICNLKCKYCFISHTNEWERKDCEFKYPVEHIIKALSKERLGDGCFINLTAQGETLLYKDIVKLTRGLLEEGHAMEIITNGLCSKQIDEILEFPEELLKRLFFKFSYHYEQLNKVKILSDKFWENVTKVKSSPCSFTIELMPNDDIIDQIDDIYNECLEKVGAPCHLTVGRDDKNKNKPLLTKLTKEEYISKWSKFKSSMFDLKMELLGKKRKEFCYAGKWSIMIDIASGEASQCYGRMNTQNVFKDLTKPIKFYPVGHSCTQCYCFNGHSHIAWGIIPQIDSPSYYEIRNRTSNTGENWVKNDCAVLFKQKFKDNNKEYSTFQKIIHTIVNPFYLMINLFHDISGVKRKLKKYFKIIFKKFK